MMYIEMKKVLGFIIDVLLIAVAFALTDIIMYKLGLEDVLLEFGIFLGISLVLELIHWIITRPFSKK